MFAMNSSSAVRRAAAVAAIVSSVLAGTAAEENFGAAKPTQKVAAASNEGELALKRFEVAPGLKASLFAAEPHLANPVAIYPDEQGRWYVAETFRFNAGVIDIRGHMSWLEDELAVQTVEERVAYTKRLGAKKIGEFTSGMDRVSLVWDSDGDGKADKASVFADGYNGIAEGLGSGVLARKGDVYFSNIPNLWLLRDTKGTGVADWKKSLSYGYGVRFGFIGHDLHGLRFGPDGRLYFSIGDRGGNAKAIDGSTAVNTEFGAVYRCNPDGTELEVYHQGLRNPQELAFDQFGNLWTGDNNSDAGDPARWVFLTEGGDSGWRIGWQFIEQPNARGPWLAERLCYPHYTGQPAYIVPPIALVGNGPSGLTFCPGTGLPDKYKNHFLMANYSGSPGNSGIFAFAVQPKGSSYELSGKPEHFIWNLGATDVEIGPGGGAYVSDWTTGWNLTGKGRIYKVSDPAIDNDPLTLETKKLIAENLDTKPLAELARLLGHADMRVRQEAQYSLAAKGSESLATLTEVANKGESLFARMHAIWGLGQQARKSAAPIPVLVKLLSHADGETRAQAAKMLGDKIVIDRKSSTAAAIGGELQTLLSDKEPRVRFFAAQALHRRGDRANVPALIALLKDTGDEDLYIRQAAIHALVGIGDTVQLLVAAKNPSPAVRIAAVVALRRMKNNEVGVFLKDSDPLVISEAAHAVNDDSMTGAMPQLAALIGQTDRLITLSTGTRNSPGPRDGILRRVLNANFRIGTPAAAEALAKFAARADVPEARRIEAFQMLGDWAKPSNMDRVAGLYRPLAPRDPEPAAIALRFIMPALMSNAPSPIRIAALKTCDSLGLKNVADLIGIVKDPRVNDELRVQALKNLVNSKDAYSGEAVRVALADKAELLRKEGVKLLASLQPAEAAKTLLSMVEKGSLAEKQNAIATLGTIKVSAADRAVGDLMDQLLAGKLAPELQLDVLEAAAKRSTKDIKAKVQKHDLTRASTDTIAKYRECLQGGNAAEGKKVYFEKPEGSCMRCHLIAGTEGGIVAPELTHVASRATREHLLESIIAPNAKIAVGFEVANLTLKNGKSYSGTIKKETDTELEINSPEDGDMKFAKADIEKRTKGLSGMLEGLGDVLTKQDIRNVVEFLSTLK